MILGLIRYGIGGVGSSIFSFFLFSFPSSDFSTIFFSWGYSPFIYSLCFSWSTSSVSISNTTSGGPGATNSLPLLKVIAFTCYFPFLLRFTFELLGNEPRDLSINKVAIWPIYISKFLNYAAWLLNWVDRL